MSDGTDAYRSHHVRLRCPHCEEEIRVGVSFEPVDNSMRTGRRGPEPIVNPEVDEFIIRAIDDYKLSFHAVGKLLEEKEMLAPKGGKRWFPATVSRTYYAALDRKAASNEGE